MASIKSVSPASPIAVVCDAGPLIHLDEISCLDLLADFQAVQVVDQVWEEVLSHRPSALASASLKINKISVEPLETVGFQTLIRTLGLHHGEIAALSLMHEHPTALFLTDDAAARVAAKALGFRGYGTLGVLLRSIRRGQRESREVLEILRDLPQISTLHVKRSLLQQIIAEVKRAKESP